MKKVALLMSGGIDSSYSAYLLNKKYEVYGIYLKLHNKEEKHEFFINRCKNVADKLQINFQIIDLQKEFNEIIYKYFIDSYKNARTPNPCAMCNPNIKFGLALEKALSLGCDYIASGHYARIVNLNGINYIQEAVDKTKDQSYFLFGISKEAKDRLIFPLGDKLKTDVKREAFAAMPWFGELEEYKDSQEICFVDKDYIKTISKELDVNQKGIVKDKNGNIIGEHKGYMQYTIGKRKGFDVPLSQTAQYVLDINAEENVLIVGSKEDLLKKEIIADAFITEGINDGNHNIKIRYRSNSIEATIKIKDNKIFAYPLEKVYGVANGQALVIYRDDVVLGGGFIEESK
ncbi:tRNA 2-thiouridine(34) synthase MnmA [Helicobacter sp. MIT 14-3879]|uniref:tRNA 2-thiouridine(34) synthase MnmA n=1 Tax=Helicobacter sp. MIT 14-3879 TaxID=2040649 RepID=UPI000E1E7AEA|nr:tRNA 2-thiouridine(34) synthase MnmA [Helicobacter sp. MIT 14-3879]RDU65646.1 tRNA 2-thiouridine(34) synthase MnmA [Helicobacter sp. MIT 14-3879]